MPNSDDISVRGILLHHEPMSRHCSWRTGGTAELFFQPADVEDLVEFCRQIDAAQAITWLGLGSNVLVRDGGITGAVIATAKSLTNMSWLDANRLSVECGAPCAKVAKAAAKRALGGGDFFAGIPGTMGGALAMNAGAYGCDTWSLVDEVEVLARDGSRRVAHRSEFAVSYRQVSMPPDQWFLRATLRFEASSRGDDEGGIRALLNRRNASQPLGTASCGSVFKNPPGDFAGRLIDSAGLKMRRIGGCYVSDKHANFIINDGSASASDIESLIEEIQRVVAEKFGVSLEPEVRILGRRSGGPRMC